MISMQVLCGGELNFLHVFYSFLGQELRIKMSIFLCDHSVVILKNKKESRKREKNRPTLKFMRACRVKTIVHELPRTFLSKIKPSEKDPKLYFHLRLLSLVSSL